MITQHLEGLLKQESTTVDQKVNCVSSSTSLVGDNVFSCNNVDGKHDKNNNTCTDRIYDETRTESFVVEMLLLFISWTNFFTNYLLAPFFHRLCNIISFTIITRPLYMTVESLESCYQEFGRSGQIQRWEVSATQIGQWKDTDQINALSTVRVGIFAKRSGLRTRREHENAQFAKLFPC